MIKDSYEVNQLPAYDIRGDSIYPGDYEEKLAGAIVRVCFTIVHYDIKQKHVFNTLVRDITVLRPPSTISPTSLKHILHPSKKKKFLHPISLHHSFLFLYLFLCFSFRTCNITLSLYCFIKINSQNRRFINKTSNLYSFIVYYTSRFISKKNAI